MNRRQNSRKSEIEERRERIEWQETGQSLRISYLTNKRLTCCLWKTASPWQLLSWKKRKTVMLEKKNAGGRVIKYENELRAVEAQRSRQMGELSSACLILCCQTCPLTEWSVAAHCLFGTSVWTRRQWPFNKNETRIAAAKRLLRDIWIAVNVWLDVMNHFHRITSHHHPFIFWEMLWKRKKKLFTVCRLPWVHIQFILTLKTGLFVYTATPMFSFTHYCSNLYFIARTKLLCNPS